MKENARDVGWTPESGRSPGGENGNPFQNSCLKNAMDSGACWATVHRVAKGRTQLSDWTCMPRTLEQRLANHKLGNVFTFLNDLE